MFADLMRQVKDRVLSFGQGDEQDLKLARKEVLTPLNESSVENLIKSRPGTVFEIQGKVTLSSIMNLAESSRDEFELLRLRDGRNVLVHASRDNGLS